MVDTVSTGGDLVTLTVDDKEVQVPKGTNLIEAAKAAGVEVPYYCYHPHLSVPGNCRMCQVEVEGAPKLMIGCHTHATEGMKVRTHVSSKAVEDAQASTLEMLLINHPLDCTVCDQAGHCKLQDYHYEYNARPSRFLEEKEHKVKAEPLGPTVMLDGERCIACTRCVRFCDEITGTSELGMLNRGDRYVIAVDPDRELDNPLSGTVVDLCPVGALTHTKWRFNTRLWYARTVDTICPGCSTGCNTKVYVRDNQVVQVKARLNADVNKEWLCDEGRYGFDRFAPEQRFTDPERLGSVVLEQEAWADFLKAKKEKTAVLVSPDLMLEDYFVLARFLRKLLSLADVAVAYRERTLTPVEAVLISPDYAANFRAAQLVGLAPVEDSAVGPRYESILARIRSGEFDALYLIGDRALLAEDQKDSALLHAINQISARVSILADRSSPLAALSHVVLPARTILEKSGLMINRGARIQFSSAALTPPPRARSEWYHLNGIAALATGALVSATSDRELTREVLREEKRLHGLSISSVKGQGVSLRKSA